MATIYLGIGANIGDKKANCEDAVRRLGRYKGIKVVGTSSFYGTRPVGGPPQENFLNGVVKLETAFSPHECLETCKGIEKEMGRVSLGKDHPRVIDMDILMYDSMVMDSGSLVIPHPRMHERYFVLRGLVEIAPDLVHPVIGKTVRELYSKRPEGRCQIERNR